MPSYDPFAVDMDQQDDDHETPQRVADDRLLPAEPAHENEDERVEAALDGGVEEQQCSDDSVHFKDLLIEFRYFRKII